MPVPFDLVIRNGRFVTPDGIVSGDLAVTDGKIAALGTVNGAALREVAAEGRWVMPGGVDPHAHIAQMSGMGLMNADSFETATRSAAMGGTTSVISFAAQAKGERLAQTVAQYASLAAGGAMIDHAFHITVTDLHVSGFADDLAMLIDAGHRSIKVFTTYNIMLSDADILRVLQMARRNGALVCVHAENDAMIADAKAQLIAAGKTAPKFHAASHPRMAEIEAVERMCRFAEYTGQPVMLFHISTAQGVAAVRAARQRGAPVRAETCPHYLFMTEAVLHQPGMEGAKYMCSPPQRAPADQVALWDGLLAGDLDLVSSDHAPYRFDATGKLATGPAPAFDRIANGLPGLETRLPLLFDAMVSHGRGGPEAFARLTATAPAAIYGLPGKGAIQPGHDADLVIWDADRVTTYGADDLHDNTGYNPWVGRRISGWPVDVFLRGTHIVANGVLQARPGSGRWIDRPHLAVAPTPPQN